MYMPDLVKNAASWGSHHLSGTMHTTNAFAQSREWGQVAPPTLKSVLRYADGFKKHMDLPPNFHPHTGVASSNVLTINTVGQDRWKQITY